MGAVRKLKKKSLREHVEAAQAAYNGLCDAKNDKRCSLMEGILAVHSESNSRPAFEVAPMLNAKTGKWARDRTVYFVRNGEYALVAFCPFCGEKLG